MAEPLGDGYKFAGGFSPVEVGEVAHFRRPTPTAKAIAAAHYIAPPVVAPFMGRVVTGPAQDDAVVDRVRAAELEVFDMMGLGTFAEGVAGSTGFAQPVEWRAATGTPTLLAL